MRVVFLGMAVLAVVIAWSIPTTAHHSNALYFDMSKAITLEGEVLRMEWINPHILLFLQSKNDKGQSETWILHGSSLGNALRQVGSMKEQLKPGTLISARVWPSLSHRFQPPGRELHQGITSARENRNRPGMASRQSSNQPSGR